MRLASASLMNSTFTGSNFSGRPSCQAMYAAWQMMWLIATTAALEFAGLRVFTHSRKFFTWLTAEDVARAAEQALRTRM